MRTLIDRPWVQDWALVVAAIAFGIVALGAGLADGRSTTSPLSYGLVAAACWLLLVRRRNPFLTLVAVAVARVLLTAETGNEVALMPAAMIALYTVGRLGDRRRTLIAAVGISAIMMVLVAALDDDGFLAELAGEGALLFLPLALGDAARSRAERIQNLIEAESAARVQAERLRIARDLHDVVAHGLSTIAVQSGVAGHLLDRDREQAREALTIINDTGKKALEELRTMVGVLRSTDDAPVRPTPTDPNDLDDLIAGASHAGLRLTTTVEGRFPDGVGDATVVAVHRIIQEALTNVARHAGSVAVELAVRHLDGRVEIRVRNAAGRGPATPAPSTGVGIVGMTERAESVGGTLRAGPDDDGGFTVEAEVPYQRQASTPRTP